MLEAAAGESLSAAGVVGDSGRPPAPSAGQVLGLQRFAGNRAVSESLSSRVQRVAVRGEKLGETLYNQGGTGGKAGSAHYSLTANYDIVRDGDAGATVTVRILYLNQSRNTTPKPAGAPPGTPDVGDLIGSPTEIPPGDDRRTWATDMTQTMLQHWNGKLVLVGESFNPFGANTEKRIPVTFKAVPVWSESEKPHARVVVHPSSVVGGSTGNPIDAGNFYPTKDDKKYPAKDDIIYAHEYGHLIGIPDEYSQSNEQMNALLHEAAPKTAPSALAALDKKTVERMALAALTRPMYSRLSAALPAIVDALRGSRKLVSARMKVAAREAVQSAVVRDELRSQLEAASEAKLAKSVPTVVAFQTTKNFSSKNGSAEGVDAGFSVAALSSHISDTYWKALLAGHGETVDVKGLGATKIDVSSAVYGAAGAATPQAGAAAGLADDAVGPAAPAAGLPYLPPPESLGGKLSALPATWAAAGSDLESKVTPEIFAAKMESVLKSSGQAAALAAAIAALVPGMPATPLMKAPKELYRRAYDMVSNASREAAQQVATDLIGATVDPLLEENVKSIQSDIASEVTRIMSTSPAAIAAAGTPTRIWPPL